MRSSDLGDGRLGKAMIASKNRQRDRGDLLAKVFASDHKHCYDTRHDEHGIASTANTWIMSWWKLSRARGDASAVRCGPAVDPYLRQTPALTTKYLNATIQTEKCLSQVSQRHK